MADPNDTAAGAADAGGEPYSPDNRAGAEDAGWDVESSGVGKFQTGREDEGASAAGAGGDDAARAEASGAGSGAGDEGDAARGDRARDGRGRFAKAADGQERKDGQQARDAEPAKADAGKGSAQPGKDSPTDKRLRQLDARGRRFEREAHGWRDRALRLEEENTRLRAGGGKGGDAAAGAGTDAATGGDRREAGAGDRKAFAFPKWEQWSEQHPEASHEDYMDARTDARDAHRSEQRTAATREVSAQAEEAEVTRTYVDRMTAYKTAHPEFVEALEEHGDNIPNSPVLTRIALMSERSGQILHSLTSFPNEARAFASLSMPVAAADFIADSPIAESLILHIARNPAEFRELLREGPVRGMRALAQLESQVQAARAPKGSAGAGSQNKRPSAPIRPVDAGGPAGRSDDGNLGDEEFGPDWVAKDNARDRRLGRRR